MSVVRIDAGVHCTATEVTDGAVVTVTVVEADLLASWLDVAVIVAVPAVEGVKTPFDVIVPLVALQVTELL